MNCEIWQDKLDAFVDLELPAAELRDFQGHLRGCAACSAEAVARQRLKSQTRLAGQRFSPSAEFEKRMLGAKPARTARWNWLPALATAAAAIILVAGFGIFQQRARGHELVSQFVDEHVATMASANPVDVVSTDSHNVKPWFQGKVPFSVDMPNIEGSQFTLVGGKVSYVQQNPVAQLVFAVRQHRISVFVMRETSETARLGEDAGPNRRLGFNTQSWTEDGLRYFAVSDVNPNDVRELCERLKRQS
ncbi:MAG: anti-sigma factor family protein [Terriglobales bacterium]|jgi:anti-sigma factor RsiW